MTPPSDIHPAPVQRSEPQHEDEQLITQHEGEQLIMFLEHEQLASDRSIAVPPAQLSRSARAALWLLRIFALIVSFMVVYTFVSQLQ